MNKHLSERLVVPFEALRMTDVESVGGKNASLGEMISQLAHAGVRVPGGFATTAQAFRDFLAFNHLTSRIAKRLTGLNVEDVKALAQCGEEIRHWIESAPLQPELEAAGFAQDCIHVGSLSAAAGSLPWFVACGWIPA